jgi:hypothetical protein
MENAVQETVVTSPVDAENAESSEMSSTSPDIGVESGSIAEPTQESEPKHAGEAIKREVERRMAKESERLMQQARDAYIAEQGYQWNGKAITTEREYQEALQEKQYYEQYQEQNYPDEVIPELIEAKKIKEQFRTQQEREAQQAKQQTDFQAFVQEYPNVKGEEIPAEVWAEVDKGKSLVDAYAKHENALLKSRIAELEGKKQIEQKNTENKMASTGSVTGNNDGNSTSYFTPEQVDAMSREEVNRNWKSIMDSQKKWYKR